MHIAQGGGLNHLPCLLSISVSIAVIEDFFYKFYEGSWAESSIYVVKLSNNYYIV